MVSSSRYTVDKNQRLSSRSIRCWPQEATVENLSDTQPCMQRNKTCHTPGTYRGLVDTRAAWVWVVSQNRGNSANTMSLSTLDTGYLIRYRRPPGAMAAMPLYPEFLQIDPARESVQSRVALLTPLRPSLKSDAFTKYSTYSCVVTLERNH